MYGNWLEKPLTRRSFLRLAATSASLTILGLGAACGPTTTPGTVEKVVTRIVEHPVEVTRIIEKVVTQIVEKPVEVTRIVEKKVVETKVVEKALPPNPTPTPPPKAPERILFVGNQLTTLNGGVHNHLRSLAASANPPLNIETSAAINYATPLANQLKYGQALEKIREAGWDVVVLQEIGIVAVHYPEDFYDAARKLDSEIKNAGGQTAFFMDWGREEYASDMTTENLEEAYDKIGKELGAIVVPVGLAWQKSIAQRPDLSLYGSEGLSPTILGTYLSACVFYATLFVQSPVGLSYAPEGISEEKRTSLQQIAWDTVQEYEQPAMAAGSS